MPFCLLALFVVWLVLRLVWDFPFWMLAVGYCLAAVLLFVRPIQAVVLTPLFGARKPTSHELRIIDPLWRRLARMNDLPAERYMLRVLPLDELNAFACGGHLVVVTTFAIEELPEHELAGVLAHELSHHLGMHTVALTIGHWLSLPVVVLARVGFFLQNVATAATDCVRLQLADADSPRPARRRAAHRAVVAVPRRAVRRRRVRQRRRSWQRVPGRPAGGADGLRAPARRGAAPSGRPRRRPAPGRMAGGGSPPPIRRRGHGSPASRRCCAIRRVDDRIGERQTVNSKLTV